MSPIQEELYDDARTLQSRFRELHGKVRLSELRDTVEDLQTTVNGMRQRVAALRARGYVFEKNLEDDADNFVAQWRELRPAVLREIERQDARLQQAIRPLDAQVSSLMAHPTSSSLSRVESRLDAMESDIEAAERAVRGMFDAFRTQVEARKSHLNRIEWMLDELAEATFTLLPTEGAVMAVKAVWAKNGEKEEKGDPEGVLYLTDQRIFFEQKEKVATKKVLFIATEKKLVQQTLLEFPVALVEEAKPSQQGFMGKDDYLELRLASGAPISRALFHIWEDGDIWQRLIHRVKTGEFADDRAVEIDEETLQKVKSAPTKCPACGATISQVILRGQDTIVCEYCGHVIRL